jgi:hypothetical protein
MDSIIADEGRGETQGTELGASCPSHPSAQRQDPLEEDRLIRRSPDRADVSRGFAAPVREPGPAASWWHGTQCRRRRREPMGESAWPPVTSHPASPGSRPHTAPRGKGTDRVDGKSSLDKSTLCVVASVKSSRGGGGVTEPIKHATHIAAQVFKGLADDLLLVLEATPRP